jgi:hypothetical protein
MEEVVRWGTFELRLEREGDYGDPTWDATVKLHLTSPSGKRSDVNAFWDGGKTWRARFCADEVGRWNWRSECSDADNAGLHGREGSFDCIKYLGNNPLYLHGIIRLSENRRYLVHADGTPFFWMGDTAWNGVIRASVDNWANYLKRRRQQGFSVIQFVSTHWRASTRDPYGEVSFTGDGQIRINPSFFQRLDPKVVAVNANGLVAAPVILWACVEDDPGRSLSEEDASRLAEYIVARWGAFHVIWILGGDGDYRGGLSDRWRKIGRRVFGERHDRLVTMHPGGLHWVADEFRDERWYDIIGYQSGHGDSPESLRWLSGGPPADEWRKLPPRPIINLEPNYETHPSYHSRRQFTDLDVRRASYWSLLNAPMAGVTFGHNATWLWADEPEIPEGHASIGTIGPWRDGLDTSGTRSMTNMRWFIASLPWWRLRPAPEVLAQQPDENEPRNFVAAAKTDLGDLAVFYLPEGGAIEVNTASLGRPAVGRWHNPRTGLWTDAGSVVSPEKQTFYAPDEMDWILCISS